MISPDTNTAHTNTVHADTAPAGVLDAITDAWPGAAALKPIEPPPWLRVEATLMATARAIRQAFDHRLATLGLNLTHATMLAYLAEYGPVSQTTIADHNGIGRAATGTAIDRLQQRGLVERQPDPNDRRVWLIELTGKGRSTSRRIAQIDGVLQTELRAGISRTERQTLARVMTRLQQNVASALADDQPPTTATPMQENQ